MSNAMVLPELWTKTQFTRHNLKIILSKYKHLINFNNRPSILEFGFADGGNSQHNLAPLIPSDYKEFVATDVSPAMVEYAKKNVVIPRSEICELDIACENLPALYENRFNHIFSFFVLHMVKNQKQAFRNIHTMLKGGGETFNIMFRYTPGDPVYDKLRKHPRWGTYNQEQMLSVHYDKPNPKEFIEKDLIETGFKIVEFEVEDMAYTFPNKQAYEDLSISTNATIANIPDEDLEEYKECFLEEIKKLVVVPSDDGTNRPSFKFRVYIISAKKM